MIQTKTNGHGGVSEQGREVRRRLKVWRSPAVTESSKFTRRWAELRRVIYSARGGVCEREEKEAWEGGWAIYSRLLSWRGS
jgi:hypothetical protein